MKFLKVLSPKVAQAPGTLQYVGSEETGVIQITILDYDEKNYSEKKIEDKELSTLTEKPFMRWIDIDGVHSKVLIESTGKFFNLHPLVLEDIMNTGQRAKIESYNHYLFFVFKMIYFNHQKDELVAEQVSLIVGEHYVLSFQEKPGDIFDPVRNRIKNTRWRERKLGADYLAYALLDAVVDHYFIMLEKIGDKIEDLEAVLNTNPTAVSLEQIHHMKKEIIFLRKSVWPLREVVSGLQRNDYAIIKTETKIYFRDVYDHIIQVMDTIESFRDVMSGLQDLYMSSISNRMNEVMKVLTVIATIFIPPTFIAGIYGMNFEIMPELKWPYGYVGALISMIALIGGMLIYFKRKKWF